MTKYSVAYIDESDADIRRFQRFASNHFNVIPIAPDQQKEETVNKILESHANAVIADFDLSEQNAAIHYNGTDLIRSVLEHRELFPVFILTSFEDDAVSGGDDVNIVYEKTEMSNDDNKFLERVKTQIEKYSHKLDQAEKRLMQLFDESKGRKLDASEEEEVLKLDSLIEKALDKQIAIPLKIRQGMEANELSELLNKVDNLAKKLGYSDENTSV